MHNIISHIILWLWHQTYLYAQKDVHLLLYLVHTYFYRSIYLESFATPISPWWWWWCHSWHVWWARVSQECWISKSQSQCDLYSKYGRCYYDELPLQRYCKYIIIVWQIWDTLLLLTDLPKLWYSIKKPTMSTFLSSPCTPVVSCWYQIPSICDPLWKKWPLALEYYFIVGEFSTQHS